MDRRAGQARGLAGATTALRLDDRVKRQSSAYWVLMLEVRILEV